MGACRTLPAASMRSLLNGEGGCVAGHATSAQWGLTITLVRLLESEPSDSKTSSL